MSFSPDMVITLLGYVRTTLQFIDTIKSQPSEIAELGSRVRFLSVYLSTLQVTLRKRRQQLSHFTPEQHAALTDIVDGLQADVQRINILLEDYRGNKGPWGIEWRFDIVSKVWHELGPRKEELEGLGAKIDRGRRDLSDTLGVMGFDGIYEVLDVVNGNQNTVRPLTPEPPPAYSSTPPPQVSQKEYRIIFVDPFNTGRSVVAEAIARMLQEWTRQTGGRFPVSEIHSAGFHTSARSDTEKIARQNLVLPTGTQPLSWHRGNEPVNTFAFQSMFHPAMCRPQVCAAVEPVIARRRSRGIRTTIFSYYDYIVVFHSREFSNLLALKRALMKAEPSREKRERMEKARIVHIGMRAPSGKRMDVLDVATDGQQAGDGHSTERKWLEKVQEIRGLTQEFLTRRCGWTMPDAPAR